MFMQAKRTVNRNPPATCTIDGCDEPHRCKGMCKRHYDRSRHGTVPVSKEFADPENPDTWARSLNRGYVVLTFSRGDIRLAKPEHRWVMEKTLGRKLLFNETVHHKNGNRSDNRPTNLELWSSSQPAGQRVEDKLSWAREIIALYGD